MYIDQYCAGTVYPGFRDFERCVGASGEDYRSSETLAAVDFVYGAIAVVGPYGVEKVHGFEALNDVAGEKMCWVARVGS